MEQLLLGLDVGTTYCKALVLDSEGQELSEARARTPWASVPTGAELDPHVVTRTVHEVAASALADAPAGVVAAVGVAGMAETGVLLDRRGEPVGPAIAWHDVRGTDEARAIASELDRTRFAAQTGLPASPLCSLAKLRWQRAHDPGAAAAVRWLGMPEWIARSLGAADAAELSLASRTGMLSLRDAEWWPEALAWLGVPESFVAEPVWAGTPLGSVGDALPAARGAVITVAGHDHVAATVGAGATGDGDVLHSSGTADVFVRSVRQSLEREQIADAVSNGVTVGWHVLPERWALLSGNELNVSLASVLQMLGVNGQAEREALGAAAAELGPDAAIAAGRGLRRRRPAVAARHRTRHEPCPRLAGRAGGGSRSQRRDPGSQRRGRRVADAHRGDRRRGAGRRGASRQGREVGCDRVVARPGGDRPGRWAHGGRRGGLPGVA